MTGEDIMHAKVATAMTEALSPREIIILSQKNWKRRVKKILRMS